MIMLLGFLNIPSVFTLIAAAMCVIGYGYELIVKQVMKNGGLHMETKMETFETKNNNKCKEKTAKVMETLLTVGNLGSATPAA